MRAAEWKDFYAKERAGLGERGLERALDEAPEVEIPAHGALVFPHARLAASGRLTGAVARAIVRSGAERVLALGVLHGARREDEAIVARARGGDRDALASMRRVHGPGVAGDEARWSEEFSLDGLRAMVDVAARREGRRAPEIVERYPFLVGDDPTTLPGLEELARLAEQMPLVATTDPIHHGVGYGTRDALRDAHDPEAHAWARRVIEAQLRALAAGRWKRFASLCAAVRSDFRDDGPALATLLGARMRSELVALDLVDYADVLSAAPPTWVAAPLVRSMRGGEPEPAGGDGAA